MEIRFNTKEEIAEELSGRFFWGIGTAEELEHWAYCIEDCGTSDKKVTFIGSDLGMCEGLRLTVKLESNRMTVGGDFGKFVLEKKDKEDTSVWPAPDTVFVMKDRAKRFSSERARRKFLRRLCQSSWYLGLDDDVKNLVCYCIRQDFIPVDAPALSDHDYECVAIVLNVLEAAKSKEKWDGFFDTPEMMKNLRMVTRIDDFQVYEDAFTYYDELLTVLWLLSDIAETGRN